MTHPPATKSEHDLGALASPGVHEGTRVVFVAGARHIPAAHLLALLAAFETLADATEATRERLERMRIEAPECLEPTRLDRLRRDPPPFANPAKLARRERRQPRPGR